MPPKLIESRVDPRMERRTFAMVELRVEERADGEGDDAPRRIVGHAAVFDSLSEDLGGFREKVAPGAFAASIASDDIRALFNHNPDHVLGRNGEAGTLRLAEDDKGLAIAIDTPDTQVARDLVTSIERGDISQMSFGFRTIGDEWQMVDGENVRTLQAVKLFDVSPVTFPAYLQTDVAARSLDVWKETQKPPVPWKRNLARRRLDLAEPI